MSKLSLLKKNAYLTIVVKDNAIWSHLAYVDYNNDIQYILSDYTDISHFNKRLDDYLFMENFWDEYFILLEKLFGWKLIQRVEGGLNRMVECEEENIGVNGIKVLVDDNQEFLPNIFHSITQYSHDIAVRVLDAQSMREIVGKLSEKLGYEDMIYIDLDINSFQIYRVQRRKNKAQDPKLPSGYKYSEVQQYWNNKIGIIDAIKDRRLHAFMASDMNNTQLENSWANLVMHPVDVLPDPNLVDILRSFTTVQLFSLLTDNRKKLEGIGSGETKTLIVVGGKIPRLLGKKATLLSIIDGLELYGIFDVIWDNECKIQAYGMSMAMGSQSKDIVIGRNDVISAVTKVLIPELKSKKTINKVVFSAIYKSQDFEPESIIVLGGAFKMIKIKNKVNKVIFEGKLENNVYLPSLENQTIEFISAPLGVRYDNILIDSRLRPIVYGTDGYSNKLKIEKWLNDN